MIMTKEWRYVVAGIVLSSGLTLLAASVDKPGSIKSSGGPDPAPALSDARSFAVTGHVYANPDEFEYILKDVNSRKIPVLFVGGDIENSLLSRFREFQNTYHVRIIPVPGNHEIQSAASAEEYYRSFGNYRAFDTEKIKFLLLNTMDTNGPAYPHGGVGIIGSQLKFIKKELSEGLDQKVVVIMGHALWSTSLSIQDKKKMAESLPLDPDFKLDKIQFPSNDTSENNWMESVHPLLASRGGVAVFAGDASLTSKYIKDGVSYIATGLRQSSKPAWIKANKQSYVVCTVGKKVACDIQYFSNVDPPKPPENRKKKFIDDLISLTDKHSAFSVETSLRGLTNIPSFKNARYIVLESSAGCNFPSGYLTLMGEGYYSQTKSFSGLDVASNKRIYFVSNHPGDKDSISSLGFYRLADRPDECPRYSARLFDFDFTRSFLKYNPEIPRLSISLGSDGLSQLQNAIPVSEKKRNSSTFKFSYVNAKLTINSEVYDAALKNRGGTSFHWAHDKKSYTVKLKDYFKHAQKLLLYVPDKRAYTGEFLVNQLAKLINLDSLESSYRNVWLNRKNYGTYYFSEDFDTLFLAKRELPEANIYNTDPYSGPGLFNVEAIPKNMMLPTIKKYQKDYDRDVDYSLEMFKLNAENLMDKWSYGFAPENIANILALALITGTAHYAIHNIVFYVNHASGRIYFFPWDFMNYTHVGDLQRDDLKTLNNDYLNVNQIFTHLLEIPEIRTLRNRRIYKLADKLTDYLHAFDRFQNIGLMTLFFSDPTCDFPEGEGNRPSLVDFLRIPEVIIKNISYLKGRIAEMKIKSEGVSDGAHLLIKFTSESYGELLVEKISLKDVPVQSINNVQVNGVTLPADDYSLKQAGVDVSVLLKNAVSVSPKLEYKKEYAAPILLVAGKAVVSLGLKSSGPTRISFSVLNPATDERKDLSTNVKMLATAALGAGALPVPTIRASRLEDAYPVLRATDKPHVYSFRDSSVVLDKNLVLPKGVTLNIIPGTTIKLGPGVSIISYGKIIAKGSENKPILFVAKEKEKPWGSLAILQEEGGAELEHCKFDFGSGAHYGGAYFSGMVSVHYADALISNCEFRNASKANGDDGLNIKYGYAKITHSLFVNNAMDGLDLDFVRDGSIVVDSVFENSGDDNLDISGSKLLLIKKNKIKYASKGKGVSVGEGADVLISNCAIDSSVFGVAVKDASFVTIRDSVISGNRVGVAAYNKKELYGGAHVYISSSVLSNNAQNYGLEYFSPTDWRAKDLFYKSYIHVDGLVARTSGKSTREVILESLGPPKNKKALFKKVSKQNIDLAGNTYATLVDTASK